MKGRLSILKNIMLSHWLKEKKNPHCYLPMSGSKSQSTGNEKDYPDFYILESEGISISNAFICLRTKFAQFQHKNFFFKTPPLTKKTNNATNTWFSCDVLFYNH